MTTSFEYTMSKVCVDRLVCEIHCAAITAALDHITTLGTTVTIVFKTDLTQAEEGVLDDVVAAHSGEPLPEDVVTNVRVKEKCCVATPDYRTFWDNVDDDDGIDVDVNTTTTVDYAIPKSNLYTYGGEIIIQNGVMGDQIQDACVYDKDGLVPVELRSNYPDYPILRKYIDKLYVPILTEPSRYLMDTRPLIANIPAGFYLRLKYKAVNSGSARKLWINYHFLEKIA